jgi:hypothetical protein
MVPEDRSVIDDHGRVGIPAQDVLSFEEREPPILE